jgi:hypothetical protein
MPAQKSPLSTPCVAMASSMIMSFSMKAHISETQQNGMAL